jgi:hypothetical protein
MCGLQAALIAEAQAQAHQAAMREAYFQQTLQAYQQQQQVIVAQVRPQLFQES